MVRPVALVVALAVCTAGCVRRVERRVGPTLQTVDLAAPYLKVHMKNGDLYVLSSWTIDEPGRAIVGAGELIGPDRSTVNALSYRIPFADVALYETDTVIASPGVAALAVILRYPEDGWYAISKWARFPQGIPIGVGEAGLRVARPRQPPAAPEPTPAPIPPADPQAQVKELTAQASAAGIAGDCAKVIELDATVAQLDSQADLVQYALRAGLV